MSAGGMSCCQEVGVGAVAVVGREGRGTPIEDIVTAARQMLYLGCDTRAIWKRDPALRSGPLAFLEVPLYASFWAMVFHRPAHLLHVLRVPFLPRLLSQIARFLTGIEIHPGAVIGPGLFIDHGMGVVIGATAIVGQDVLLYHGVTLGGVDGRPGRRHPRVGDRATIGAGAKVLGPVDIGAGARVGAQAVVLHDIPAGVTAVGVPARIVTRALGVARGRALS